MLELKGITKSYATGDFVQRALDGVTIAFRDNEFVAVLGPSGSGKSTLLNILGGLDHPDEGDLVINGISTKDYGSADWDTYRNHRVGFVFQSYNLIPHQTVLSNVELALTLSGVSGSERTKRAMRALERVGLAEHAGKLPSQLSGGQMQRVAIARALVNDPDIVLADEPTGALDAATGIQIMDLLKEVADDRLVIMVTHNPDLAERYATRIVRLSDGRIVDDSRPIEADERSAAAAATLPAGQGEPETAGDAGGSHGKAGKVKKAGKAAKGKKASMSFRTALSLSFNNLMTKKGRTFLTSFAGSIGIMGIAAILALSTGINDYIAKTEEDTMSGYPITITRSSTDFSQFLPVNMAQSDVSTSDAASDEDIPVAAYVTDTFDSVSSNDLSSFKAYLDSGDSGIDRYANAITYDYCIRPSFYRSDPSQGTEELGNVIGMSESSASDAMSGFGMSSGTTSFEELFADEDLLKSQYDLVRGEWPDSYDEAVLVLDSEGRISDYTLYNIGVLDQDEFNDLMTSLYTDEEVDVPDNTDVEFTYDDALALSFKVVEPADLYEYNAETGTWTDMSDDDTFMTQAINDGITVRVVGVIRPNEDTSTTALTEGIAYSPELIDRIREDAEDSEIVQQQLANPDVDVFTGKTFEELQSGAAASFDMGDLFDVDETALANAFSFDASSLNPDDIVLELSGITTSTPAIDPGSLTIDTSALSDALSADTVEQILAGAPVFDPSTLSLDLTADQQAQVSSLTNQLVSGFLPWWYEQHPGESISTTTDLSAAMQEYLASDGAQEILDQINEVVGDTYAEAVQEAVSTYLTDELAPYITQQLQSLVDQAAQVMAMELSQQLQAQMAASAQAQASEMEQQISAQMQQQMGNLASSLQSSFSVDPEAFENAITLNMTQDELTSLLESYANASQLTYENNLATLGYADEDNPVEIDIYPKDFNAKQDILDLIDSYNERMRDSGQDDQVISYSDIMGSVLDSITDIVNTISTILIAFVSISLVVSSIMIGVITYISVLERRKEIGILRALGASKTNVANVFNAETFIEGLLSGVIAIVVVLIAEQPVNAWIYSTRNVPNVMQLTPEAAVVLVLISVALTVIAGLIPASSAARKDPVEALRSE